MNSADEKIIKQVILLLRPFKHIIQLMQSSRSPSLYMVLLSIQILKDAMSSYNALLDYKLIDNDDDDRFREGSPVLDDDLADELQGKGDELPSYIIV